jgi:hypothetical protein
MTTNMVENTREAVVAQGEEQANCVSCGRAFVRGLCRGAQQGTGRYYHATLCRECAGCGEEGERPATARAA